MGTCVVNIVYEYDNCNKAYLKKVLLCGILDGGRQYVNEITYQYPTKKTSNCFPKRGLITPDDLGTLGIQIHSDDLTTALKQFKVIIAKTDIDVYYLEEFVKQDLDKVFITQQDKVVEAVHLANATVDCDSRRPRIGGDGSNRSRTYEYSSTDE